MNSATTILAKTEKGRQEMQTRHYGLSPPQRRVLIIIDGIKNLQTIAEMIPAVIPAEQHDAILSLLIDQGFIEPISVAGKTALPVASKDADTVRVGLESELTADPTAIREVKDFMTTTAHTYLGLLGADVIQRIERTKTAAQLMTVAGLWHLALHESQQGKKFAVRYLEQVKAALSGKQRAFAEAL